MYRENTILNNIHNVEVIPSDLMSSVAEKRYNIILTNPPFHLGVATETKVVQALIESAYHILYPGGQLIMVANKFLRYDRLLNNIFENVKHSRETNKYHLLTSQKIC